MPLSVAIIDNPSALPGVAWWPTDYWVEVEQQAAQILAKAGVDDAKVSRRCGRLVPMMIALAHDASLLVLGSRGHSRAGGAVMGSVSQHLARHAPCPLAFACRRAETTGEKVSAVRAAKAAAVHLDRKGMLPADLGTFLDDQEERLAKSVATAAATYPDVGIGPEFIVLAPAEALIETSRHASLVVVGSRGLNAFTGMLLGSVTHEVLHRAHCPVVVVR